MDEASFKQALRDLAANYHLPKSLILQALEDVFEQILTARYRDDKIRVHLAPDFSSIEILGIHGPLRDVVREIPLSRLSGTKNLHKHLKRTLDLLEASELVRQLRRKKHTLALGTVLRKTTEGDLYVEIALNELHLPSAIIGCCTAGNLPIKERRHIAIGQKCFFHVRDCYVSLAKGDIRLEVCLDRITKNLPLLLIEHFMDKTYPDMAANLKMSANYRRSGEVSEIWTNQPIPSDIKNQVTKHLPGEKLLIFCGETKQEIEKKKRKMYRSAALQRSVSSAVSAG